MRFSDPIETVLSDLQNFWGSEDDTFGRVCHVLFDISEFTEHTEISRIADCSSNAAKKVLERLVELGIAQRDPQTATARYRRSRKYIEWRALYYIAEEFSMNKIIERVEALEQRKEELIGESGNVPSVVESQETRLHESVGSSMQAANELEQIKRRIRLYELGRQISQNNGHLISRPF